MDSIKVDEDLEEAILGFRQKLAKTYFILLKGVAKDWQEDKNDWKGDKNDWRKVIDN